MKIRYSYDQDDIFRRYVRPWAIGILAAILIGLGIWWLLDTCYKNTEEYKRRAEIQHSLEKAPEGDDYRSNVPDEEIGNYYYGGEEIIDYPGEIYLVKKVISGEKILVNFRGKEVVIDVLGVNVPACYAKETKEKAEKLLLNRRVKIDFDEKTKYSTDGDISAMITIDTMSYNLTLVSNGYGDVDENASFTGKEQYIISQEYAKYVGAGHWSACKSSEQSSNRT